MADTKKKVTHTITEVNQASGSKEELLAKTKKNATPYRIGAVVFWLLAIGAEVMAILFFAKKIPWEFAEETPGYWIAVIGALVLDLIFLIIGSSLWKKANHLDPASKKNEFKFWLQNNLGVIVAAFAFIPFVILALTDKNADKKSKTIATIVAVVALAIGGLTSYDWNPVSQEEMLQNAGIEEVYWTAGGGVFHLTSECSHLNNSEELFKGTATAAIEAGKTRVCKTCERRAEELAELEDAGAKELENEEQLEEEIEEADPTEDTEEASN